MFISCLTVPGGPVTADCRRRRRRRRGARYHAWAPVSVLRAERRSTPQLGCELTRPDGARVEPPARQTRSARRRGLAPPARSLALVRDARDISGVGRLF